MTEIKLDQFTPNLYKISPKNAVVSTYALKSRLCKSDMIIYIYNCEHE